MKTGSGTTTNTDKTHHYTDSASPNAVPFDHQEEAKREWHVLVETTVQGTSVFTGTIL